MGLGNLESIRSAQFKSSTLDNSLEHQPVHRYRWPDPCRGNPQVERLNRFNLAIEQLDADALSHAAH